MPSPQQVPVVVHALPLLAARPADANKGNFGRVLIVAGSRGMSGAAVLCGSAALRGGAGLVRVAVPEGIWNVVAAGNPCLMTAPLPQDAAGRLSLAAEPELAKLAQANDVLAIGPGLSRSADLDTLLARQVSQLTVPVVLDADGLNAFAGQPEALKKHGGPLIVT